MFKMDKTRAKFTNSPLRNPLASTNLNINGRALLQAVMLNDILFTSA